MDGNNEKIEKLEIPQGDKDFYRNRALEKYVGVHVLTDICAPVNLVAPGNVPVRELEYKLF